MVKLLVKLLTGGTVVGWFGPWMLLAGVIVIGGAGFVAGSHVRSIKDAPLIATAEKNTAIAEEATQACMATHEKARADGAENAIAAMLKNAQMAADVLDGLAKKAAVRRQSLDQLLKDIANAPPSKSCGTVAAERSFRLSVQPPAVPAVSP